MRDTALCTCDSLELLHTLSTFLVCFHGPCMILPPKPFFPPLTCSRVVTESFRSQVKTPLLKHLQVLGPFTLLFPRLFSTWE